MTVTSALRTWVAGIREHRERAADHVDYRAVEAELHEECEQIIERLAHPGCWFCQRGTAFGHVHIPRPVRAR